MQLMLLKTASSKLCKMWTLKVQKTFKCTWVSINIDQNRNISKLLSNSEEEYLKNQVFQYYATYLAKSKGK